MANREGVRKACPECHKAFIGARNRVCCGPTCTKRRRERLRGMSDFKAYRHGIAKRDQL